MGNRVSTGLFAAEAGSGKKTIVLLHGVGGSSHAWRSIQSSLSAEAHTLAYDLPGHGKSLGVPQAGPAKLAAHAILADLSDRGIEEFHVTGHSMGGAVAALMALAEPRRVAALTLLAPGGFGEEINGRLLRRYAAARSADEIRDCLESMFGWPNPVPEDTVRVGAEMRAIPGQVEKLVEIVNAVTRGERQGVIGREQLAGLAMPVTVVWGQLDAVLPVHQTRDLPPRFGLHLVPDAGHMLPEEVPELVAELIRRNAR
jgi:pimeloyl-ACP methyl ester carboxylesterase